MYAIVEIAGQQFKVAKDRQLFVHRLNQEEGKQLTFDDVYLVSDDGKTTVGAPVIEGASVTATVNKHLKGDKVIVFKKKRRKGHQKKNGHRQYLSHITIDSISLDGSKKTATKKASTPKVEEEKTRNSAKLIQKLLRRKKKLRKAETTSQDLNDLTVAELKAMAKDKGLEGYSSLKKAELIELIEKA